jgi:hypothetical protein
MAEPDFSKPIIYHVDGMRDVGYNATSYTSETQAQISR